MHTKKTMGIACITAFLLLISMSATLSSLSDPVSGLCPRVEGMSVAFGDGDSIEVFDGAQAVMRVDPLALFPVGELQRTLKSEAGRIRITLLGETEKGRLRQEIVLTATDVWVLWDMHASADIKDELRLGVPVSFLLPPFLYYKAVNPSPFGLRDSLPDSGYPYSIIWGDRKGAKELQLAVNSGTGFAAQKLGDLYVLSSPVVLEAGQDMEAVVHYASKLKDPYPALAFDKNYQERGLLAGELPSIVSDGFTLVLARSSKYTLTNQPQNLILKYYALDSVQRDVMVNYRVVDMTGHQVKAGRTVLASGGRDFAKKVIPIRLNRNSMYRMEVEYSSGAVNGRREAVFGVLPKVQPRGFQEDSIFGGHNGGRDYWGGLSQRMGMKWNRRHCAVGDTGWGRVEVRKGQYDWARLDAAVDFEKRYGIMPLGVFESFVTGPYGKEEHPDITHNMKELWKRDFDAYIDSYLKYYVIPLATRYKGHIKYWEIENEPYYYFMMYNDYVENYVKFLKAIYQTLKSIDPEIKVVGTCGPPGYMGYEWYERTFALGALDYQDVVSAHLYPWGPWWKRIGTEAEMRKWMKNIRMIMRKHGKELPLWNSETTVSPPPTMYTLPYHHRFIRYHDGQQPPDPVDFAQMYFKTLIVHKVEDVKHFFFIQDGGDEYTIHMSEYDDTPFSLLVAQAGMAKHLEDAQFIEEIPWHEDLQVYLFRNERGYFLVIWGTLFQPEDRASAVIPIPVSKFRALDIFDNPLPVNGNDTATSINIGYNAFYLYVEDMALDDLRKALDQARISVDIVTRIKAGSAGNYSGAPAMPGNWIGYHAIDISTVANRGFRDDSPADKEGGWVDQGMDDMRNLAPGEWFVNEIPFRILDPEKNNGKSCIVLRGVSAHYFPQSVTIPVGKRLSKLHFIHAVTHGNTQNPQVPAFTYILRFTDGYVQEIPMYYGEDVFDWAFTAQPSTDVRIAWKGPNPVKDEVRLWQKESKISHPLGAHAILDSIEVVTGNGSVPVVVAITGVYSN